MTTSTLAHRLLAAARAFGSARRVAAAVESRRDPVAADLERLGISAAAFAAINMR